MALSQSQAAAKMGFPKHSKMGNLQAAPVEKLQPFRDSQRAEGSASLETGSGWGPICLQDNRKIIQGNPMKNSRQELCFYASSVAPEDLTLPLPQVTSPWLLSQVKGSWENIPCSFSQCFPAGSSCASK